MDGVPSLVRVTEIQATVLRDTRWFGRYQMIHGAAALAMVLTLGLVEPSWERLVASAFGLFFTMLLMVSIVMPVVPRGYVRRFPLLGVSWMIPCLVAQIPEGIAMFEDPAWWLPGALAASAPGFVGALIPGRPAGAAATMDPEVQLDAVLKSPVGLSVVVALADVRNAESAYVRDTIAAGESEFSEQVAFLETAGYLKVHKRKVDKRTRVVLALTKAGRTAFQTHRAALRAMTDGTPHA